CLYVKSLVYCHCDTLLSRSCYRKPISLPSRTALRLVLTSQVHPQSVRIAHALSPCLTHDAPTPTRLRRTRQSPPASSQLLQYSDVHVLQKISWWQGNSP